MFKDYKYSVICKTYIASFFRFLLLSTSNVRMSEGTFCRVAVHMVVAYIASVGFYFKIRKNIALERSSNIISMKDFDEWHACDAITHVLCHFTQTLRLYMMFVNFFRED